MGNSKHFCGKTYAFGLERIVDACGGGVGIQGTILFYTFRYNFIYKIILVFRIIFSEKLNNKV